MPLACQDRFLEPFAAWSAKPAARPTRRRSPVRLHVVDVAEVRRLIPGLPERNEVDVGKAKEEVDDDEPSERSGRAGKDGLLRGDP